MKNNEVFQRYELKYRISRAQKEALLRCMADYMELDSFGHHQICNLYLDTPDHRLIRRSLEHPSYKEKLRVRSYGKCNADGRVYVELKKKYKHVVYKRRMELAERDLASFLQGDLVKESQIGREIAYSLAYYPNLAPRMFIAYEREAYRTKEPSEFRVTFDENLLYRREELDLTKEIYGTSILPKNEILMELKVANGIPMWMVKALSELAIYKTSFSKYGTAYEMELRKEREKNYVYKYI